jgi:hypothetical protein
VSEISPTPYTADSVLQRLFQNMMAEGHLCILFLKNVERIRYGIKRSTGNCFAKLFLELIP